MDTYPILKPPSLPPVTSTVSMNGCFAGITAALDITTSEPSVSDVVVVSILMGTTPTPSTAPQPITTLPLLLVVTISVFTPFGVFVIVTFTMVLLDGTVVSEVALPPPLDTDATLPCCSCCGCCG